MSFETKLTILHEIHFLHLCPAPKIRSNIKNNLKGRDTMHFGSKGWYVKELKKLGIRTYEGRKLESYRAHILARLLEKVKRQSA